MASDKNQRRKQPAAKSLLRDGPNWPLFVLAVLGMALSGYLTFTAWSGKTVAFCTEGAGCDVVLSSRCAQLFCVPPSSSAAAGQRCSACRLRSGVFSPTRCSRLLHGTATPITNGVGHGEFHFSDFSRVFP